MTNTLLIALLCVAIGVLGGVLLTNALSNRKDKESRANISKEKMEFSKRILLITFGFGIVIIAFAMYIIYLGTVNGYGSDSTALNTLLGGLFTEISVGTGFYYWKSRKENIIKLESTYGRKIDDVDEGNNNFNDNYTGI